MFDYQGSITPIVPGVMPLPFGGGFFYFIRNSPFP
jgi:hypothetical protein